MEQLDMVHAVKLGGELRRDGCRLVGEATRVGAQAQVLHQRVHAYRTLPSASAVDRQEMVVDEFSLQLLKILPVNTRSKSKVKTSETYQSLGTLRML